MKPHVLLSESPESTERLGAALGERLTPGDRVALSGPLGAGKTAFARGVARGIGSPDVVRSPSYVLVHAYEGPCPVYHCDWYRLEDDADVASTGIEDLLAEPAVVIVEWADKAPDWLDAPRVDVLIEPTGPGSRRLTFRTSGEDRLRLALARLARAADL